MNSIVIANHNDDKLNDRLLELTGSIIHPDNDDEYNESILLGFYDSLLETTEKLPTLGDLIEMAMGFNYDFIHEIAEIETEEYCRKCKANKDLSYQYAYDDNCKVCYEWVLDDKKICVEEDFSYASTIETILKVFKENNISFSAKPNCIFEFDTDLSIDSTDIIGTVRENKEHIKTMSDGSIMTFNDSQQLLLPSLVKECCIKNGGYSYLYYGTRNVDDGIRLIGDNNG